MKKLLLTLFFAFSAFLTVSAEQTFPAGTFTLKSGDYQISFLTKSHGAISGFAYMGKELFVSQSSSAGTQFSPNRKETKVSLKLTVDGQEPAKVSKIVSGEKLVLERVIASGAMTMTTRYTVTPAGLLWQVSYKLADPANEKRPSYFYLFTAPWSTKFTEFAYTASNRTFAGKLTNSGKWEINSRTKALAIYDPADQIAVVTEIMGDIPSEIRHNSIWDHKSYHKYHFYHKRPAWKEAMESPEYSVFFHAFKAAPDQWKASAENFFQNPAHLNEKDAIAKAKAAAAVVKDKPVVKKNVPAAASASTLVTRPVPPVDESILAKEDWLTNRRGIEALDDDFILPLSGAESTLSANTTCLKKSRSSVKSFWQNRWSSPRSSTAKKLISKLANSSLSEKIKALSNCSPVQNPLMSISKCVRPLSTTV